MSLLLLACTAFWPLYLSRTWAPIDRYTHVHALLGTLWLVALLTQPLLMIGGYRAAHLAVGRGSLLVAVAFVASSLLLVHFRVSHMSAVTFAKEGRYIYLPLAIAILFGTACVLGFAWRASTQVHACFMASTALLLLDPLLARIMDLYLPALGSEDWYQGITFTLVAVLMAALALSLPRTTRGHGAFRNYCVGTGATLALYFAVPGTAL